MKHKFIKGVTWDATGFEVCLNKAVKELKGATILTKDFFATGKDICCIISYKEKTNAKDAKPGTRTTKAKAKKS